MHVQHETPYGVIGITVLPDEDEFWAVVVDAPEAALGVLQVAVQRYITLHQQLQHEAANRKPAVEVAVERRKRARGATPASSTSPDDEHVVATGSRGARR